MAQSKFKRRVSEINLPRLDIEKAMKHRHKTSTCHNKICFENEEDTVEQGKELFGHFVKQNIQQAGLQEPKDMFSPYFCRTPTTYRNPMWAKTGRELREIADEFQKTKEREKVRDMAMQLGFESLRYERFKILLEHLFHSGKVTVMRVVVLFVFCSDLVLRALEEKVFEMFETLFKWCMQYITDTVCKWVQAQGGWCKVVMKHSIPHIPKVIVFLGVGMCVFFTARWAIKRAM